VYKMRKAIVEPVFGQIKDSAVFAASACVGKRECQPRVEAGVRGQQPAESCSGPPGFWKWHKTAGKGAR